MSNSNQTLKAARKPMVGADHPEIEESRNRARLQFPLESIAYLNCQDAVTLQRVLQHGDTFGVWQTRPDWLARGFSPTTAAVNIQQRVIHFLPERLKADVATRWLSAMLDSAVLTCTRYLALLRMGPSGQGRDSFRALAPSTVATIAFSYVPPLLALGIAKRLSGLEGGRSAPPPEDELMQTVGLLSELTTEDLAALAPKSHAMVVRECERMAKLGDLELWWDIPMHEENRTLTQAMTGPALHNDPPRARDPHRPLPDDYVAEMGARGCWLIRELAPNLFELGESILRIWKETDSPNYAAVTVRDERRAIVRDVLQTFDWRDSEGRFIEEPPFPLLLRKKKGFEVKKNARKEGVEQCWPPRTYLDFMALLGAVQSAHLFVCFMSMGARKSEILGLERTCVVYAVDGRPYSNGLTFKMVERHEGEMRDWLLPDAAVMAFEQQVRLVKLGERVGTLSPKRPYAKDEPSAVATHLWGQFSAAPSASDATLPLHYIGQTLRGYARILRMDHKPGGQLLRSQRFRKTLARLVALALTQAPRVLMEVFGHEAIESTMYYILADKELRSEIETVVRELRVMRAKEVVEKMVQSDLAASSEPAEKFGGYGGPAALAIHNAIEVHRQQRHRLGADWDVSSASELAELLTLQGKAWEQVRRGVICTKFAGEAGPCNKSKGRPEPSKCQSNCGHRLEEGFLREDVDGAIRDSVDAFERAVADEESLTAEHWAAQVRAHVPRFPDLRDKWMANLTVQALMAKEAGTVA